MNINKQILMTIVKNSSNYLEGEQEILKINEKQLHFISKEISELFSLYDVMHLLTEYEKFASGENYINSKQLIDKQIKEFIEVNCA